MAIAAAKKNYRVCKLLRSLYGLKQASRCWNKKFTDFIKKNQFMVCESDPCVFVREQNGKTLILAIYIDDGIIVADDEKDILAVIDHLCSGFEVKAFAVNCFLGLQIDQKQDGSIHVHQEAYAKRVLDRFGMLNCAAVSTPGVASQKLSELTSNEVASYKYREAVGRLMYLAIATRPDISFAVGNVSRYMEKPTAAHVNAVKRIFRYRDADYVGDIETRRSTSGHAFFWGKSIISWSSQRQKSVSTSTTESEYIAASEAIKELIWIQRFRKELLPYIATFYMDNQGAIRLIKNPEFHKRTKHIDVRYHFIREKYEQGCFVLKYIPTDEQLADIFTKALPKEKHQRLSKMIGLQPN